MKLTAAHVQIATGTAVAVLLLSVGLAGGTWYARTLSPSPDPRADKTRAPLVPRSRIILPGVLGRIDHFGYDGRRGNLFVSALGNHTVEVVNNLRVIHSIRGLGHPQAALYVGEFDRLAVSGKDGKLRFYDGKSFAPLKTLDFGTDTDNMRYEPEEKRIYLGYGDGAIAMVDPAAMERLPREFPLGSHPESFQFERRGRRIFVNLPDQESIGVIDRRTGAVTKWRIEGTRTNHALAFDEAGRRLFSAALQPGKLWVIDSESGRVISTLKIVLGVDDIWFDSGRRRILATGHAGAVSVIRQRDADHYDLIADIPTGVGGGTSLYLKSRTSEGLYVALPNASQAGSEILFLAVQE
ncbi:MAG TPA: WD40 repeat domain-containing protein [Burkholderiales bacterium]|nr:WD40 repeat domain-containing protein [Burkholderiales bacterium]